MNLCLQILNLKNGIYNLQMYLGTQVYQLKHIIEQKNCLRAANYYLNCKLNFILFSRPIFRRLVV